MDKELKIESFKKEDINDYKELYGKLRDQINVAREGYKANLINTKEGIESLTIQLKTLETKKGRLEGAIESSDILLKSALPSNKK